MKLVMMVAGLLIASLPLEVFASPLSCQNGTAADYIALGSVGCLAGNGGVISNFEFSISPNFLLPLGSVQVSPMAQDVGLFGQQYSSTLTGLTLTFSPALAPTFGETIDLIIGYTVTFPVSRPIFDEGYRVNLTPPGFRGLLFQNGTSTVRLDGAPFVSFDANSLAGGEVGFPNSASIDVRYSFPIWADTEGREIAGFAMSVSSGSAPEPSSWLLTLSASILVGVLVLRRQQVKR